jgi:hypothetical protein
LLVYRCGNQSRERASAGSLSDAPVGRTSASARGLPNEPDRSRVAHCQPIRVRAAVDEVAARFKGFRVEHLKHVGWQLFRAETYVNRCGPKQEVITVAMLDGRVTFVPVLGEAH